MGAPDAWGALVGWRAAGGAVSFGWILTDRRMRDGVQQMLKKMMRMQIPTAGTTSSRIISRSSLPPPFDPDSSRASTLEQS